MIGEDDTLLSEDKDQATIRAELSNMSFEDLQKLKEKLGTKVYNEAIFGPKKTKKTVFKRENKNRPREESAKKQVSRFREVVPVKKQIPRDPRFDSLCGTFDEKEFKRSYKFLSEVKRRDLNVLKSELKTNNDPKQIKKIQYLIQRLENQIREEDKKNQKEEKERQEKQVIIDAIERGEKPKYRNKSEKKVLDLVDQYEKLRKEGKLKRHMQRLRKKNTQKERAKLKMTKHSMAEPE